LPRLLHRPQGPRPLPRGPHDPTSLRLERDPRRARPAQDRARGARADQL